MTLPRPGAGFKFKLGQARTGLGRVDLRQFNVCTVSALEAPHPIQVHGPGPVTVVCQWAESGPHATVDRCSCRRVGAGAAHPAHTAGDAMPRSRPASAAPAFETQKKVSDQADQVMLAGCPQHLCPSIVGPAASCDC